MANSRFEYVKQFEKENFLLPQTFILIRVDGKGFHKFSEHYGFEKPNDKRALAVINSTARAMMTQFPDISLAYGDSDEYSFLLRRDCDLFERREMKLVSTFASFMSVYYVMNWNAEFPEKPISAERLPTFDARAVVYPNVQTVRDYFSWRQVDCHINNLYNTVFWGLVQKCGLSGREAENKLKGTLAKDKNEILFSECGINYNNEPELYKKGTVIVREFENWNAAETQSKTQRQKAEKMRKKAEMKEHNIDIIGDAFWDARPWLLD